MILNAVKTENRSITYKELSLRDPFLLENKQSSEGIYGLLYPGEVLERYRDKTEDTLQKSIVYYYLLLRSAGMYLKKRCSMEISMQAL